MKSRVDDQPAGPEDGLREVAEEAVLVFEKSHLSAKALGVEGPTLAVARVHGKAGRAQVGAEKINITKLKVWESKYFFRKGPPVLRKAAELGNPLQLHKQRVLKWRRTKERAICFVQSLPRCE